MSEYKPKKGDRVRVVLEGDVSDFNSSYTVIRDKDGNWLGEIKHKRASIEKVAPPVVTFKPGDVVRSKDDKYLVALGGREYTYLANPHYDAGTAFPYGTHEGWGTREFFNSERFEKVEL